MVIVISLASSQDKDFIEQDFKDEGKAYTPSSQKPGLMRPSILERQDKSSPENRGDATD
jgi:hypothetical protein